MIDPGLGAVALIAFFIAIVARRKEALHLRFRPDLHTAVAIGTGLLVAALSATMLLLPTGSGARRFVLFGLIWGLCGAAVPWGWVLLVERGGPADLGWTRRAWKSSCAIGLALAIQCTLVLFERTDPFAYPAADLAGLVYALLAGGLFETFLYYGFIHIRLDRAFGPVPAIIGSSTLYAIWHFGSELPLHPEPLPALLLLFVTGIYYHSVFSLTRNVLIVYPFFFLGGVLIDFLGHLDLPDEVGGSLGWTTLSWIALVSIPLLVMAVRRGALESNARAQQPPATKSAASVL